jgi:flavin reductase (DIM6/NTAB) family NADH-FMN oxidoreductase RutF
MSSSGTSGADAFHELLSHVDSPMVIVTAGRSGCLVGFSTQVSIDPPRFLVCVSKANHTHHEAMHASVMAVHILDHEDGHLARVFGELTGDTVDKLSLVEWYEGPVGVALLDGAAGWFAGRVLERVDLGDHTGFVLEPIDGERRRPITRQLGFQAVKDLDPGHEP